MKYLIVADEALRDHLVENGYELLNTRKCLNQNSVWTFLCDGSMPFCFDINDASVRQKCVVTDKLTMTF